VSEKRERAWEYRYGFGDDARREYLRLPALRERYDAAAGKLELLYRSEKTVTDAQKNLQADCWEIRKEAFRVLVKAHDAGFPVLAEATAFGWETGQLENPALRDWLKSADTARASTEHNPLGTEGLWHTPDKHVPEKQSLPAYIENTAHALMRDGMEESQAIATAVNAVKSWAEGKAFGGKVKVTPEVQQAAQRALREWEDLKASHH
jgi:hypothetical protein